MSARSEKILNVLAVTPMVWFCAIEICQRLNLDPDDWKHRSTVVSYLALEWERGHVEHELRPFPEIQVWRIGNRR